MPEGPPFEVELERNVIPRFGGVPEDYGYLVIHIQDQAEKAQELLRAASCELVFQGDEPVDVVCHPLIQVSVDKRSIQANGVDAAVVTAQVEAGSTAPIVWYVDGLEVGRSTPIDGRAELEFVAQDPGHYVVEAESLEPGPPGFPLKYGRRGIAVEVVA